MAELRFLFNGEPVNSPGDWMDFDHEFARDYKERSIGITYENTVTFSFGAHDYLRRIYEAEGYCAEVDFTIEEKCGSSWAVAARGKILLAESRWNETNCTVEVSVVDNGIGARIDNNKGIPISPTSPRSKNGEEITAVPPLELTFFNPYTGADISGTRRGFDWMECVKHAVQYMSDGEITVESPWYDALPDDERYAVGMGNELRVAGVVTPRFVYAWKDLFHEMGKLYNLFFLAYEGPSGQSFIRIAPESTFFADTGDAEILNIQGLERYIDTERIPASVSVGNSDEPRELQTGHALPFVVMFGHTEEQFHFTGVCNTNDELDLTSKWLIGTNAIEEVVVDNVDDYDKDLFLIQYDQSTSKPTAGTYLNAGAAPYLYNEQLLNFNVLRRYDLPSPVGANYDASADTMKAEATVDSQPFPEYERFVSTENHDSPDYRVQFDDDYSGGNFDTNNNWGNGTTPGTPVSEGNSRYTAEVQGFYSFNCHMVWRIITAEPRKQGSEALGFLCHMGRRNIAFRAILFNASDVQIGATPVLFTTTEILVGQYVYDFNFGLSMNAGDYVEVHYTMRSNGLGFIPPGSPIPCDDSYPNSGGNVVMSLATGSTIKTDLISGGGFLVPENTTRIEVFEFERQLPLTAWSNIANHPEEHINIDGNRLSHPLNVKRNIATGEAEIKLIRRPFIPTP
jgi:hypothetical protein